MIRFDDVHKSFGDVKVLDGITFEVVEDDQVEEWLKVSEPEYSEEEFGVPGEADELPF